jgi:type III pantothenate kinase
MRHFLVLDIGNSRTKAGLFNAGRLLRTVVLPNGDAAGVVDFVAGAAVTHIGCGSVAAENDSHLRALEAIAPVTILKGDSPGPIANSYGTPSTLGVDRWANAVAAASFVQGRAALAIDLGTCITYDLVTTEHGLVGGIISPGLRMRSRAMHAFSARLPEGEAPEDTPLIGTTPNPCLASGAHHGIRAELRQVIAELKQQHPDLGVVLTGGDAPRFARALENGIFAHPYLTLLGLHALLVHAHPYTPVGGFARPV